VLGRKKLANNGTWVIEFDNESSRRRSYLFI
jgi:hypothetical protein